MRAKIGERVPNLSVSKWVQGLPTNFDQEKDHIVVVEVFQVNCPGCFLHGIPETIDVYNKFRDEGVTVLGFATAFEDFDKNTLENLELLLKTGEVIGETKKALSQYGKIDDSKLTYKIPFPVGMDALIKDTGDVNQTRILDFIHSQIPDFDSRPQDYKDQIIQQVKDYMKSKEFVAETFEKFSLQGTPSTIIVDRKGILRDVSFGQNGRMESIIQSLLKE